MKQFARTSSTRIWSWANENEYDFFRKLVAVTLEYFE